MLKSMLMKASKQTNDSEKKNYFCVLNQRFILLLVKVIN